MSPAKKEPRSSGDIGRVRPGWDDTWMTVARTVAQRSMCDRARVGAVIVTPANRIVATGYNGPPAGLEKSSISVGGRRLTVSCLYDCPRASTPPAQLDPHYNDCITIHAEMNALMFADRTMIEGGTLYVTGSVCLGCSKAVANSGLARVVVTVDLEAEAHRRPKAGIEMMERSGLTVDLYRAKKSPVEALIVNDLKRSLHRHLDAETDPCAGEWPCDVAAEFLTVTTDGDIK